MSKAQNLVGKKFGRWTVLKWVGKDKAYDNFWLCGCQCGTERVVRGSGLNRKHRPSLSCGCLQKEIASQQTGSRNPRWNGGKTYINGYLSIRAPNHSRADGRGYVRANIFILEQKLGRSLHPDEVAHHKDGDIRNNDPDNLEAKTKSKHASDHHSGEKCWKAKLTEEQVRTIRNTKGKTQTALAKEYGVSQSAICYILSKRNWKGCR